jgi:hypothetical protein
MKIEPVEEKPANDTIKKDVASLKVSALDEKNIVIDLES